jgi:hypothetical protein
MVSRTQFLNAVLVVLSAVNLVAVWFAVGPGEPPWHATTHAALALGFGLWAQRRMRLGQRSNAALTDRADERLERMERGIEAVAIEVERIGEMERFASKIREGRSPELEPIVPAPKPMPPRTITPP